MSSEKELAVPEPTEEQRAFAESLLRDCSELHCYGYGGAKIERDFPEALRLVVERDAKLLADALRPFEELAEKAKQRGAALSAVPETRLAGTAYEGMAT
jgi:hypothetical protein